MFVGIAQKDFQPDVVSISGGELMFEYDAVGCVSRIRRGSDVLDLSRDGLSRLVSVSTNGVMAESYWDRF